MQCVIVKKSTFMKEQEVRQLSSSLGVKTPWSETPLLGPLLF